MLLKDKVAVITGAASVRGLGFATAKLYAGQGAKVVIIDLEAGQRQRAWGTNIWALRRTSATSFRSTPPLNRCWENTGASTFW
jgi:NAD(P)-dependent dehydrogenase (short-subunit alcohol dehydrogenase family)